MILNTEVEVELISKIKCKLMPLYKYWDEYYKNPLDTSISSSR
jgi:hypothetical protein